MATKTQSNMTTTTTEISYPQITEIDVDEITISAPKPNQNGKGKSIGVLYNGEPLTFQCGLLKIWTPSDYEGNRKFSAQFRLGRESTDFAKFQEIWEMYNSLLIPHLIIMQP